jgi:uncharacterized protein YyaL (SSP411 family)
MNTDLFAGINTAINQFVSWLDNYGETSYDHQSFFAGPLTGRAKALYYKKPLLGLMAVAPMVFCEAFIPSARQLFWKKQRLPIADAHYAMGFVFLYHLTGEHKHLEKAVHFLDELEKTRCPDFKYHCWGYPFDWETRNGTISMGTPLITTTPYAYEAFSDVYQVDKSSKWLEIMRSISEHAANDIKDFDVGVDASTCSYTPFDRGGVINASAYRAFLLTNASIQLSENRYWQIAERNLNFVIKSQQPDGSWYYAMDSVRDFVDHFHTCFILKALAKIERLTGHKGCKQAIEKGLEYYVKNLFTEQGLPKPFSKAPRLTVYRHELYDYAEFLNLYVLLKNSYGELDTIANKVLEDLLTRWRKTDGSFRSRKLLIGWDNVPMHRWAQSQIFRSLSLMLYQSKQGN